MWSSSFPAEVGFCLTPKPESVGLNQCRLIYSVHRVKDQRQVIHNLDTKLSELQLLQLQVQHRDRAQSVKPSPTSSRTQDMPIDRVYKGRRSPGVQQAVPLEGLETRR